MRSFSSLAFAVVLSTVALAGCGGEDRKFEAEPGADSSVTETGTETGTDTGGGSEGGDDTPPADGSTFDCKGKPDGTECGGGSICLAGECKGSSCGDGFVNTAGGEDCEDGNDVAGDGCTACKFDCKTDADCDDKNECTTSTCDKSTAGKQLCKSTNVSNGTTCKTDDGLAGQCKDGTCAKPGCGNGIKELTEKCDDGNKDDSDGCKADCTFTCETDKDCDDGDPCSGVEKCDVATHKCVAGTPVNCTVKSGCTGTCDKSTGKCGAFPDLDKDGAGCDVDCNDTDPAMFPGAFECKDGKDNDCNPSTADGTAPSCTCYADGDKDGYAASGATELSAVTCPDGYTRRQPTDKTTIDCKEGNASVNPAQASYFTSGYCPGFLSYNPITKSFTCSTKYSYDYNCDGVESQRYTTMAASSCSLVKLFTNYFCTGSGWTGVSAAPACGASASYKTCTALKDAFGTYYCTSSTASRTQECR